MAVSYKEAVRLVAERWVSDPNNVTAKRHIEESLVADLFEQPIGKVQRDVAAAALRETDARGA